VSKTAHRLRQRIHDVVKPPGNFRLCKSVILLFAYCFLPAPYLCRQATFRTTTSIKSLPDRILSPMSCRRGNPPHCASSLQGKSYPFLSHFIMLVVAVRMLSLMSLAIIRPVHATGLASPPSQQRWIALTLLYLVPFDSIDILLPAFHRPFLQNYSFYCFGDRWQTQDDGNHASGCKFPRRKIVQGKEDQRASDWMYVSWIYWVYCIW